MLTHHRVQGQDRRIGAPRFEVPTAESPVVPGNLRGAVLLASSPVWRRSHTPDGNEIASLWCRCHIPCRCAGRLVSPAGARRVG